ncbi:histidine kinase [Maricaulis sp.]|uniref:histidine kinase n=1 Tax=Maricaulis sp. TaxID=1486257 RepID=UPI003A8EDF26
MTHFLVSEENPGGRKLEEILIELRADILTRCTKISGDVRPEALEVMANNMAILQHMSDAIELAMNSTALLDRAFGPSQTGKGGPPRIGES